MDKNFYDVPSFFISELEGQTFYRPLSRETFNLLMYKSFGLNALAFHLINLILIITNIYLVYLVTKKLSNNLLAPFFAVFFYSLSSVRNVELYYLASVQTLLAASFTFLSILCFIKFKEAGGISTYLGSILFFLLGLLSHETVIVLPVILFLIHIFKLKKNFSFMSIVIFFPFLLFTALYIFSTFTLIDLPKQLVYQPAFSIKSIFNTLGWYGLWSLGLPEALVDFVGPGFELNPNFLKWFGAYFWTVAYFLLIFVACLSFLLIRLRKKIFQDRYSILFLACFLVSISPFLLFPQHKFVYYLSFPSVWIFCFLAFISSLAWVNNLRLFTVFLLLAFVVISFLTSNLNQKTYWAAKRAAAAEVLVEQFGQKYPAPLSGTIFYIVDDPNYPDIAKEWGTSSKQAFYILSGSDALKLLYKDPSIETYYQANGGLPKNIDKKRVIYFTAKFPY